MYPCGSAQFSSLTTTIQIPFPNHTVAVETPAAARQPFENSKMKRLDLWNSSGGICSAMDAWVWSGRITHITTYCSSVSHRTRACAVKLKNYLVWCERTKRKSEWGLAGNYVYLVLYLLRCLYALNYPPCLCCLFILDFLIPTARVPLRRRGDFYRPPDF